MVKVNFITKKKFWKYIGHIYYRLSKKQEYKMMNCIMKNKTPLWLKIC